MDETTGGTAHGAANEAGDTITRREWLGRLARTAGAAAAAGLVLPELLQAAGADAGKPVAITVYKDANCGCCKEWVTHLQKNGFAPVARDREDMDGLKDSLGIPAALRSCHTGVVGRYVIEGHVPAADVKKFLAAQPKGMIGLAVPGMPAGSPGMEVPGGRADRYDVVAFGPTGATRVFAKH